MVRSTAATDAPRSRAMLGKLGRYMSIASGPRADTDPSSRIRA